MNRFFDPRNIRRIQTTATLGMLFILVLGGVLFFGNSAFAAASSDTLQKLGSATGLPDMPLPILIANLIRMVLGVIGIITVILVIYAGIMYLNAKGEPEKTKKAKKLLGQMVVGLLIIFSSYSITSYILGRLLEAVMGQGGVTSISTKYFESLSGSLGGGVVESHYPMRDATNVPQNTKIFVTFKDEIKPESVIKGYVPGCTYIDPASQGSLPCKTDLDVDAVLIYPTGAKKPSESALKSDEVVAAVSADKKTFVFKPKSNLGNLKTPTSYTVELQNKIEKANGSAAFTGSNSNGYAWNFTVSTTADTTSPKIVSVIQSPANLQPPGQNAGLVPMNVKVEITFNEAMDPIAGTGMYVKSGGADKNFRNIILSDGKTTDANGFVPITDGAFDIANGYKTIGFTSTSKCGTDPCGGDIFCLPPEKDITVIAKSASIDVSNPPQGILVGVNYDGLVDAAGNSLDGNNDDKSCGSSKDIIACIDQTQTNDDYFWSFTTTKEPDLIPPKIETLKPNVKEGGISVSDDVTVTFSKLMSASSLNTTNVSLWPDPYYSMWFTTGKTDANGKTTAFISHPKFVANAEGGWNYYPVITHGVKSAYQICMFPAASTDGVCKDLTSDKPYCCNGEASAIACKTEGKPNANPAKLPQTLPVIPQ